MYLGDFDLTLAGNNLKFVMHDIDSKERPNDGTASEPASPEVKESLPFSRKGDLKWAAAGKYSTKRGDFLRTG